MNDRDEKIGARGKAVGEWAWFLVKIAVVVVLAQMYTNAIRYRAYKDVSRTMGKVMIDAITAYECNRDEFEKELK